MSLGIGEIVVILALVLIMAIPVGVVILVLVLSSKRDAQRNDARAAASHCPTCSCFVQS